MKLDGGGPGGGISRGNLKRFKAPGSSAGAGLGSEGRRGGGQNSDQFCTRTHYFRVH